MDAEAGALVQDRVPEVEQKMCHHVGIFRPEWVFLGLPWSGMPGLASVRVIRSIPGSIGVPILENLGGGGGAAGGNTAIVRPILRSALKIGTKGSFLGSIWNKGFRFNRERPRLQPRTVEAPVSSTGLRRAWLPVAWLLLHYFYCTVCHLIVRCVITG